MGIQHQSLSDEIMGLGGGHQKAMPPGAYVLFVYAP